MHQGELVPVVRGVKGLKPLLLKGQAQILVQGVRIGCQRANRVPQMVVLDLVMVRLIYERDLTQGLKELFLNSRPR